MRVTGTSPDGAIRATVTGENELRLSLQPGRYRWYDEAGLARQLAALGSTTWVAWARERAEITRIALGRSRGEAEQARRDAVAPGRDLFAERLRGLECAGVSPGGSVGLRLHGMTRWQVEIAPGTIRHRSESGFTEEAVAAFDALIRDRTARMALLRAEHFDLGLPRHWLERAKSVGDRPRE